MLLIHESVKTVRSSDTRRLGRVVTLFEEFLFPPSFHLILPPYSPLLFIVFSTYVFFVVAALF